MPRRQVTGLEQRLEFYRLVKAGGVPTAGLRRRFGVSRKTAYKPHYQHHPIRIIGLSPMSPNTCRPSRRS